MNFGKTCEVLAQDYARHILGWTVEACNQRHGRSELDLICLHLEQWIFVEVKARHSQAFGSGVELLHPRQIQTLKRGMAAWMRSQGWKPWRLELWEVTWPFQLKRHFIL